MGLLANNNHQGGRNIKTIILIILVVITAAACLLTGCGSSKQESAAPAMSEGSAGSAAADSGVAFPSSAAAPPDAERKVIREASLTIVVSDLEKAGAELQELAGSYGGYVESAEVRNTGKTSQGSVTIMVASEKLEQAIAEIEKLGRVEKKSITGRDVTEEYYDTATRKENLAVYEKRLLEMYDKASTIEEMLEIEKELSRVRGEIESLTGRIQVLDKLTNLSKVRVNLKSSSAIVSPTGIERPPFAERIKSAWQSAVDGLIALLQGIVLLVVFIAPYLPVLVIAGYFIYRWRKKVSGREKNKKE